MTARHLRFRAELGLGGLDEPPPPSAQITLPEAFGRRFLVFVDTEEEFDWTRPRRRDAVATTAVRVLPQAHDRLRGFGVAPVYLVDYPVAESPESAAILRGFADAGECTIGAQLHPWVNPPFDEALSTPNSFVGNLPRAIERAKIAALTDRIALSFGRRPTVYRAGRYGVGPNSEALLDEAGYRLDVSVRALFDYSAEGGPSFVDAPVAPYWSGAARRLVELPLSAAYVGGLARFGRPIFAATRRAPRLRGALARSHLLARVPLTPEGTSVAEARSAIDRLLGDGARVLSISFHSPSVEPGHTPYVRDAADLRRFYRWWDDILGLLARRGVTPAGPDELLAAIDPLRVTLASAGPSPLGAAEALTGL